MTRCLMPSTRAMADRQSAEELAKKLHVEDWPMGAWAASDCDAAAPGV